MNIPENLKYTKEHEYVKIIDNVAIVGITDYAQSELGDIIFVDFSKNPGDAIDINESVASIEAVKTVSEVYSPLSGKIVEINNSINDKASVVNEDTYGNGWLFKIEINDSSELETLMDSKNYSELIGA